MGEHTAYILIFGVRTNMINTVIANMMPFMPKSLVRVFAKKYVAGKYPEDAFRLTKELNDEGAVGTVDLLGSSPKTLRRQKPQ